jgi:Na+-translocating ferredoxin:NAD+ oxidoreductase RnfG subunit
MIKIIAFLILSLIINTCLFAQVSIDYNPKMLQKEIAKAIGKSGVLKEIPMPDHISRQILVGKFFMVDNFDTTLPIKYAYVGRVNTCRAGGCSINNSANSNGNSEYFDYFIFFNSNGTVQFVKIYNYQATHGQEITAKGWLKQFSGYNGTSSLLAGKNVDAISGATISVDAITFDIEHKTELLKLLIK